MVRYVTVRLRSGRMRIVLGECVPPWAKCPTVSTACVHWVRAWAPRRWRGVRPDVRGVAMNPG